MPRLEAVDTDVENVNPSVPAAAELPPRLPPEQVTEVHNLLLLLIHVLISQQHVRMLLIHSATLFFEEIIILIVVPQRKRQFSRHLCVVPTLWILTAKNDVERAILLLGHNHPFFLPSAPIQSVLSFLVRYIPRLRR